MISGAGIFESGMAVVVWGLLLNIGYRKCISSPFYLEQHGADVFCLNSSTTFEFGLPILTFGIFIIVFGFKNYSIISLSKKP